MLWAPGSAPGTPYNGSMWLHRCGTRRVVWDTFDPVLSPAEVARRFVGTDQAWLAHVLGDGEMKWTAADGVLHYRLHARRSLPSHARIVFFPGHYKPERGDVRAQAVWLRDHDRAEVTW